MTRSIGWLGIAGLVLAGCSDDDERGPIDGIWTLAATECDGATAQSPPFVLEVEGVTGTFALTFSADCTAIFDEEYVYGDGTIEIQPVAAMCDPSDGCAAIGVDCESPPPPVTFDFELSGDALVFTKASGGPPGDPCPAGQEVRFVMER